MNPTHLAKYLVGRWGDHLAVHIPANSGDPAADQAANDAAADLRHSIGEYHLWTPNDPASPDDLCFVVMRQAGHRRPHPNWQALPHVLKSTTIADHHRQVLTGWASDAFGKAKQPAGHYKFGPLLILPTHDVVDLASNLHAIMPVFEP